MDMQDKHFGVKDTIEPASLISVSGRGKYVRQWDAKGALVWEKSLDLELLGIESSDRLIFDVDQDKNEIHVAQIRSDRIALHVFAIDKTLSKKSSHATSLDTTGLSGFLFVSSSPLTLLAIDDKEMTVKLVTENADVKSFPLKDFGIKDLSYVSVKLLSRTRVKSLVSLTPEVLLRVEAGGLYLVRQFPASLSLAVAPVTSSDQLALFVLSKSQSGGYQITCYEMEKWKELPLGSSLQLKPNAAAVQQLHILPILNPDSMIDKYYTVLTLEDESVHLFDSKSKRLWSREESLSRILSSVFVDYPLSELDASIEQTFLTSSNLVSQFVTRISGQVHQVQAFMRKLVVDVKQLLTSIDNDSLDQVTDVEDAKISRDYFGLRKLIVSLTDSGKIIAIDTQTGKTIWSLFDPKLRKEMHKQIDRSSLSIIVQRTSSHYPFPAVASVITKSGFVFTFDPIGGILQEKKKVGEELKQMTILPLTDESHVRGLLLLTKTDKIIVTPESLLDDLISIKNNIFIMTADPKDGSLTGYSLSSFSKENPKAQIVWTSRIPVDEAVPVNERMRVTFKRFGENVHSQGRVLGDRNVLYKYLNPNLAVITTIRYEITTANDTKTVSGLVDVYLIDSVTGRMVYSVSHRKAKGPVFVVHSENSVIYAYYNEKSRRTELSAVDLYEGLSQVNGSVFSSIGQGTSGRKAIIEHNTFIFPTGIRAMTDSVTEKGLTNKHLIIGIPSGGLLELPKAFLDPRRPQVLTPDHREEGLIPYIPELPIPSEGFINYNKSLMRVQRIEAAASGLESTCLIFASGLDLFHTRVTPSKTFDILKDDFDHWLIAAVSLILIVMAYVSKWLSAQKSLKAAWT